MSEPLEKVSIDTKHTPLNAEQRGWWGDASEVILNGQFDVANINVAKGLAFDLIERNELYRENFHDFEECCIKKFKRSMNYVRRIIRFALAVKFMEKCAHGHTLVIPETERVFRPILKLPANLHLLVWGKVLERAGNREPKYSDSEAVVARFLTPIEVPAVVTGVAPGTARSDEDAEIVARSPTSPTPVSDTILPDLEVLISQARKLEEHIGTPSSALAAQFPMHVRYLEDLKAEIERQKQLELERVDREDLQNRERLEKRQVAKAGLKSEAA